MSLHSVWPNNTFFAIFNQSNFFVHTIVIIFLLLFLIIISYLATAIIRDGKVPTDWEESFIVCLYEGKGDALDRGNYRTSS